MTIEILLVIRVLFAHWIADFVAQTDWMAKNKSKNNKALFVHVAMYTGVLCLIMTGHNPLISLFNGITHFFIDYVTSRMSSKLWAKGEVHNFFVVIGFDQFLHAVILIASYAYWS